jgi:hypothetical protein
MRRRHFRLVVALLSAVVASPASAQEKPVVGLIPKAHKAIPLDALYRPACSSAFSR